MKKTKRIVALAVAASMLCVAGCGKKEEPEVPGEVKLKYYVPCASQEDNNMVYEAVNKILNEKIGATVNFIPIEFGSYDQKMQVINAGRDEYDLCYTSNWLNNYYQNIEKGNLRPLDDLLQTHAKELYDQIGEKFWNGVKVNGKIYGVINQQIMAREGAWRVPEKFVEEFNIDVSKIETLEDAGNVIRTIQTKYPDCNESTIAWSVYQRMIGFEDFLGGSPVAINYRKDGKPIVFNHYDTKEYRDYIATRKQWTDEGLTPKALLQETGTMEKFKNDKIVEPIGTEETYKPGIVDEVESQTRIRYAFKPVGGALLSTSSATSTLTSIADTSKNPEKAMEYINLINTDKDLYNLLTFGIEGRHYNKVGDNRIELNMDSRYIVANWALGSVYNAYIYDKQADNVWEETKAINDNAFVSPLYGFAPDLTPVNIQLSNCKSAMSEYASTIEGGIGDTEKMYNEFMEKLDMAGIDALIAEMQKQIDEWYKTK